MLPVRVHTVVVSVQHDEVICLDEMRDALKEQVVKAVVPTVYLDDDTIYHLQPSGRFVIGGPQVRLRDVLYTTVLNRLENDHPERCDQVATWSVRFVF